MKKLNTTFLFIGYLLVLISFIPPFNNNGLGIIALSYVAPILGIASLICNIKMKTYKLIILDIILILSFPITWGIGYMIFKR